MVPNKYTPSVTPRPCDAVESTPCMWHTPELSPNQPGERRHTIDPGQTYKYSACYTFISYIKGVEYMKPIRKI